jgi:hypothetical protein
MKKNLLPYVVVYKNRFKSIDKTYNFFKTIDDKCNLISDFKFNDNAYGWATETFMFSSLYKDFEGKENSEFMNEIIKVRKETLDDYVNDHIDSDIWPLDLKKQYPFEDKSLHSHFSVIKTLHNIKSVSVRHPFFHLDAIPSPVNEFDRNHIITTMIYLNDEYEFGEIKFYDKENGFVYYKPEAGDVIIFPSFYPFYHNPNMPIGQNRYAIRSSYDEFIANSLLPNNSIKFSDYIDEKSYDLYKNGETKVKYINGKDL